MVKFSFAEGTITPSVGLRLGGYMHRLGLEAVGVSEDLYARVLRISSTKRDLAIVQLDLLGLYSSDVNKVRDAVSRVLGLSHNEVLVSTTHTHSAPETIVPMWPNTLPYTREEVEKFNEWFNNLIAKVRELSEKLLEVEDARVYYATTRVEGLCYNRSFPEKSYDALTPVLMLKSGRESVALYSTPCHPVCNIDLNYSSDYHGYVVKGLTEKGVKAVPLTGACGNVDPVEKGCEYAKAMGFSVADRILSALRGAREVDTSEVEVYTKHVAIPLRTASLREALDRFKRAYEKYSHMFHEYRAKRTPSQKYFTLFEELLYADQELEVAKKAEHEASIEIQLVKLGNKITVIAVPGELVSESAVEIKHYAEIQGRGDVVFSCYTNGYVGYIPSAEYFEHGKYEAKLALWSRTTPEAERVVVSAITSALREAK